LIRGEKREKGEVERVEECERRRGVGAEEDRSVRKGRRNRKSRNRR
jgi:hypothetical protein